MIEKKELILLDYFLKNPLEFIISQKLKDSIDLEFDQLSTST